MSPLSVVILETNGIDLFCFYSYLSKYDDTRISLCYVTFPTELKIIILHKSSQEFSSTNKQLSILIIGESSVNN